MSSRDSNHKTVIVKIGNPYLLKNERKILSEFKGHTSIRQMLDEIEQPQSLVLSYLDGDLPSLSDHTQLEQSNFKHVSKEILKALISMHEKGLIHTDIKPNNILVNFDSDKRHFTKVELADCRDGVHRDSAKDFQKHVIGTPIYRSPEALCRLPWDCSTGIWSFGAVLIHMIYGKGWNIFCFCTCTDPNNPICRVEVLQRIDKYFGPFPLRYQEFADDDTLDLLTWIMSWTTLKGGMTPFTNTSSTEITKEDRAFVCKIMKIDPKERPTAKELLLGEWFNIE
ncbi:MAG: hypothetical protein M1834_002535 [Cirrosporium novae-zelandiae]|nr:MAG: hypothetical protein M1834_002535 [Cirrosporium novae-zelandiae]